jgi:hypothetical protein
MASDGDFYMAMDNLVAVSHAPKSLCHVETLGHGFHGER